MAPLPPGGTFVDYLRMKRLPSPKSDEELFEALDNPERLGNPMPIAFGGFALATALQAAYNTLLPSASKRAPYSALGYYLGPASIDRPFVAAVSTLRETRTFSTRFVTLSQRADDGKLKTCMSMTVDFIASPHDQDNDDISTLRYSVKPATDFPHPSSLPTLDDGQDERVASGSLHPQAVEAFRTNFPPWRRYLHVKMVPGAPYEATVFGFAPQQKTNQDHLPLPQRTSPNWARSRLAFTDPPTIEDSDGVIHPTKASASTCLAAFMLDGALSSYALTLSKRPLTDVLAAASLDFAIRFTSDRVDMEQWHVHELRTLAGGWGRTFSEGRLFDGEGGLVATMTQSCIMRPLPEKGRL